VDRFTLAGACVALVIACCMVAAVLIANP